MFYDGFGVLMGSECIHLRPILTEREGEEEWGEREIERKNGKLRRMPLVRLTDR